MGGRLDSTNIISPETVAASVITGIAMDHTAFLGDTPEQIAAEKAGIIKAGVPVVFGGNHPPVGSEEAMLPSSDALAAAASCARVIREKAAEAGAPYMETDHAKLSNIRADLFGADFDFGERRDLHISLAGLYQPYNTATVLTVVDLLKSRGLTIPEEAIREGLASVKWPARFEILSRDPLIIADGGHNPEGIDAAIASVKTYFKHEKIFLLTGVMADKDYDRMVARMGEVASRAFCVRPANDRALDPARYAESFRAIGIPAEGYATVAEGVRAAAEAAKEEGKALLCLGSLYMYGEVRASVLAGEER
jgi:dihydrofolate synthase/folylpolyglutamate synthase